MHDDAPKPRRPRFSLLNLVLVMTIAAMALAIAKLAPLHWEVQRLRDRAGYLTIGDRSKVHAIVVPSESPLVWRWRVWIPEDTEWLRLGVLLGEIPSASNQQALALRGGASSFLQGGEFEASFRIFQSLEGGWRGELKVAGTTASKELTDVQVGKLRDRTSWSTQGVGRQTVRGDAGKPLVLLRERFAVNGMVASGDAGPGLLLWMICDPLAPPVESR